MKVKMKMRDRYAALALLPSKGEFKTLRYVGAAREALAPSEEEISKYKIKENPQMGKVNWSAEADKEGVEIELSEVIILSLKEKLTELDSKKELLVQHTSLYEEIVEGVK